MPVFINDGGIAGIYALYSMTNLRPERDTSMIVNNNGFMAISCADGGQKSYLTKIKDTFKGETRMDQTWKRETMMYIGGDPSR